MSIPSVSSLLATLASLGLGTTAYATAQPTSVKEIAAGGVALVVATYVHAHHLTLRHADSAAASVAASKAQTSISADQAKVELAHALAATPLPVAPLIPPVPATSPPPVPAPPAMAPRQDPPAWPQGVPATEAPLLKPASPDHVAL